MNGLTAHRSSLAIAFLLGAATAHSLTAQEREPTPMRQSSLTFETATPQPLTLRDASRNDRWLGLGVRDVRWAPDGAASFDCF